jgi:hypothetical protein
MKIQVRSNDYEVLYETDEPMKAVLFCDAIDNKRSPQDAFVVAEKGYNLYLEMGNDTPLSKLLDFLNALKSVECLIKDIPKTLLKDLEEYEEW